MSNTGDISRDFHSVGEPDSGNFSQSRIRFFRSGGAYFQANPSFERTLGANRLVFQSIENIFKSRSLGFPLGAFS